MHTKIWLNNTELREYVPNAIINRVIVEPVEIKTNYADRVHAGRFLMHKQRSHILITLQVQIKGGRDPVARAEAIDYLNAWAAPGGWLKISNRPGKQIYVDAVRLASEGAVHAKAEIAEIQFSAGRSPYWEDETVITFTNNGWDTATQKQFGRVVDFTAPTPVTMMLSVTAGTLTRVEITEVSFGSNQQSKIGLEDISIAAGDVLMISHSDEGIMEIKNGDVSLLSHLTPDSSDALTTNGTPMAQFRFASVSGATVDISVRIKGRWL